MALALHVADHVLVNPGGPRKDIPRLATMESITRSNDFLQVLTKQRLVLMPELTDCLGLLHPDIGIAVSHMLEEIKHPNIGGSSAGRQSLPSAAIPLIPPGQLRMMQSPSKASVEEARAGLAPELVRNRH